MLYWMCEKSICPPTGPQLEHAIKRNFGGLDSFNTYEIFMNYLGNLGSNLPDLRNASEEVCKASYCMCLLMFAFSGKRNLTS